MVTIQACVLRAAIWRSLLYTLLKVECLAVNVAPQQGKLTHLGNATADHAIEHGSAVLPEWDTDVWELFGIERIKPSRSYSPPGKTPHPIWHFDRALLARRMVAVCCVVILLSGILCAAGGIGGGGIFVTVLMIVGRLQIEDAVPLSKTIIFIGSVASFVINTIKLRHSPNALTYVDFNIVRLMVPASLAGTFIGVFCNRLFPGWTVSMILTLLLLGITCALARTGMLQYTAESEKPQQPGTASQPGPGSRRAPGDAPQAGSGPSEAASQDPPNDGTLGLVRRASHNFAKAFDDATEAERSDSTDQATDIERMLKTGNPVFMVRKKVTFVDAVVLVSVLFIVIFCATFRYHSQACRLAPNWDRQRRCHHPILGWMGKGSLNQIASHSWSAALVNHLLFFFPLVVCLATTLAYGRAMTRKDYGWKSRHTTKYVLVAFVTGVLSGVIGIGGGLIFSPFFIFMGVHPGVAVATSSTCVIFISASTTIQYILIDRVIISLAIVYGAVNIVASSLGTRLVHVLQDRFGPRKSLITAIVGSGVLASLVIAAVEFGIKLSGHDH